MAKYHVRVRFFGHNVPELGHKIIQIIGNLSIHPVEALIQYGNHFQDTCYLVTADNEFQAQKIVSDILEEVSSDLNTKNIKISSIEAELIT